MGKVTGFIKYFVLATLLFLLVAVLFNVLEPMLRQTGQTDIGITKSSFESTIPGKEQILCVDDNEEALLWRLRMIGGARHSIVLSTFDLRPDENGTKVMAALFQAAERGVDIKLLLDGIYEIPFLNRSDTFHALVSHENVETRLYNPVDLQGLFRGNYRMHDKYLMADDTMYLLGGRNTNDIFLGDHKTGINVDRDILVYDTTAGKGESLQQLTAYFEQIWQEPCVRIEKKRNPQDYAEEYALFTDLYKELKEKYPDIEHYTRWAEATYPADKITLISNGTAAKKKSPDVLKTIAMLADGQEDVLIQTPYVICDSYMYDLLRRISDEAEVKIILNAVENGSNPWGCTDYLNHKQDILDTGVDVYELMNRHAVHTKTVLVGDNLSIVGSYNLDMRSTYLDTELMLVIDSEQLNEKIRTLADEYMEKSIEVKADGKTTVGAKYKEKQQKTSKRVFYQILRVLIRPIRHLL
ncbi:MAG: phosphatidylserine/phosphatidylglycerophosphate/cardiolipin synthase family protein [Lachnospiraceae bacterium]